MLDINLPEVLPLLPVYGTVLMPRAQLPVPIFESEKINLILDSSKNNLLVGLVQPKNDLFECEESITLFNSGSVGKIIEILELDEKGIIVTLKGVCRFDLIKELPKKNGYRHAKVDYSRYTSDLVDEADFSFDRERLLKAMDKYFKVLNVTPNWYEIDNTSNDKLISSLTMICPLHPGEKQALLELPNMQAQSELIISLMEFAAIEVPRSSYAIH